MNDYLDAEEVRSGMSAYFIVKYSNGVYEIEKGYVIDTVFDGNKLTKSDFLDLKELAETNNNHFQNFTIDDYRDYTICVVDNNIWLYNEEIFINYIWYRLVVPESERWKSSNKLKNMNNKTGIFEMKHLKSFKDLS